MSKQHLSSTFRMGSGSDVWVQIYPVRHILWLLVKGYIKLYTGVRHTAQNKYVLFISFYILHPRVNLSSLNLVKVIFGLTAPLSFKATLTLVFLLYQI